MVSSYFIRVEFASRPPFMYSFNGVLLSDAVKSATSFMNLVDLKKPLKSEIWSASFLECVAIVDHVQKDLEG